MSGCFFLKHRVVNMNPSTVNGSTVIMILPDCSPDDAACPRKPSPWFQGSSWHSRGHWLTLRFQSAHHPSLSLSDAVPPASPPTPTVAWTPNLGTPVLQSICLDNNTSIYGQTDTVPAPDTRYARYPMLSAAAVRIPIPTPILEMTSLIA